MSLAQNPPFVRDFQFLNPVFMYGDRKLVCLRFSSILWKGVPSTKENRICGSVNWLLNSNWLQSFMWHPPELQHESNTEPRLIAAILGRSTSVVLLLMSECLLTVQDSSRKSRDQCWVYVRHCHSWVYADVDSNTQGSVGFTTIHLVSTQSRTRLC